MYLRCRMSLLQPGVVKPHRLIRYKDGFSIISHGFQMQLYDDYVCTVSHTWHDCPQIVHIGKHWRLLPILKEGIVPLKSNLLYFTHTYQITVGLLTPTPMN